MSLTAPPPEIYFDAECALCTRSAWFIDRRDRRRTLRMLALQGDAGRALREAHPWLSTVDSLIWVEHVNGGSTRVLAHSDAVLAVGRYLGGRWGALAGLAALVPRPLRDRVYRLIARHRRRFSLR